METWKTRWLFCSLAMKRHSFSLFKITECLKLVALTWPFRFFIMDLNGWLQMSSFKFMKLWILENGIIGWTGSHFSWWSLTHFWVSEMFGIRGFCYCRNRGACTLRKRQPSEDVNKFIFALFGGWSRSVAESLKIRIFVKKMTFVSRIEKSWPHKKSTKRTLSHLPSSFFTPPPTDNFQNRKPNDFSPIFTENPLKIAKYHSKL